MKCKSELKAKKAATREAKLQDKQSRQGTRGKGQAKRKPDNTVFSSRPAQKKARNDNADEEIDSERCCVCFGSFKDDTGTDQEWIMCICGRWLHESLWILMILMLTDTLKSCVLCVELHYACLMV